MSEYLEEVMHYVNLITGDQDTYFAIRDYLREELSKGTSEIEIESHIQLTWGEPWASVTSDLIGDVGELQDYEAAHGLPIEP